ncbi:hypothetical protein PanWU01x14_027970 [Parasponia andersonii]|uniref:Uncharacterized protein n=1 Tax=Parasponia andersonii TaxID=3476 RepID=A0A2P5DV74_PARAD|nr:hypothetical protein PanWU01x14_027970 [Parasponia andersonii]
MRAAVNSAVLKMRNCQKDQHQRNRYTVPTQHGHCGPLCPVGPRGFHAGPLCTCPEGDGKKEKIELRRFVLDCSYAYVAIPSRPQSAGLRGRCPRCQLLNPHLSILL